MPESVTTGIVERDEVTPEFVEEACALLQRAFDGWPGRGLPVPPEDHLLWKMNGPLPGFPAALTAELDGRLVGIRVVLTRRVFVNGEPKRFIHFVDAAVEPELQGRGIGGAIRKVMIGDFDHRNDLSLDDGSNPIIVHARDQLGGTRQFGNPVRPFIRPLGIPGRVALGQPLRPQLRFILGQLASAASRLLALGRRRPNTTSEGHHTIRTIDTFDARFAKFCTDAIAPFDFALERTVPFLNWRYADPRAGAFTIRVAEQGDRILGYAVVKHDDRRTTIADLLVDPDQPAIAHSLVQDSLKLARQAKSTAVGCWLPQRHPYQPALRAAGFIVLGRTTPIRYRRITMSWEDLAFLDHPNVPIHITHGDTDLV